MEPESRRVRELRLPDHILVREEGRVTIVERHTGERHALALPVGPEVTERRSPIRIYAALACVVFASYFSYMFLQSIFSSAWEIIALPPIMAVPFAVGRLTNGKIAVASYFGAYLAFVILRGGLGIGPKLGILYFPGGPADFESYAIVPASDLFATVVLGILPYAVFGMLGQALINYDVMIPSSGRGHAIRIRHLGMVKEVLRFLETPGIADDSSSTPERRDTSI